MMAGKLRGYFVCDYISAMLVITSLWPSARMHMDGVTRIYHTNKQQVLLRG
jgi:hypothetical protein